MGAYVIVDVRKGSYLFGVQNVTYGLRYTLGEGRPVSDAKGYGDINVV
jgi:hypothetical protein